jgi:predicted acetylornithine/succinylornithine family transaminase
MSEKMDSETVVLDEQYVMHTYGRLPVVFVRGEGCYVYDENGKQYLDLVAGIAVNGLGHCPPVVVEAIRKQAGMLMHTSNLYYTLGQPRLAKLLVELSGMNRAFFCNSGAEANEAAIKLVRKACISSGRPEKIEIITAEKSFHGRTMGAITATGQPKYQKSFAPLVPGFKYVPYNDCEALRQAVGENTCAIMLEPIQGESGVHSATEEFMATARELCTKYDAALVLDEVQTGLGRTGKAFGYQHFSIVPDIITLAKTLAGGFPMGACLAKGKYADVFQPGDHASTFGGNPLACAAAEATVNEIVNGGWIENAGKVGSYFKDQLQNLPNVKEVRGEGLMIATEFDNANAKSVATEAMNRGLIINPIGDNILRMVPPLILTNKQVDDAICILKDAINAVAIG